MTSPEINPIISEEFADLIINYGGDPNILNAFESSSITIINPLFALVHVPVEQITNAAIEQFGYAAMPLLSGLISNESLEASGIQRVRGIPGFSLRGQGVILGIIDTGIDYTNPAFRAADGTTRILSIWDQSIEAGNPPSPQLNYGVVYSKDQINEALQSENPLELVPSMDAIGHGTMIAGIAGGSENVENNFMGVATDAEFLIVKLKPAKQYLRNFFYIPEGVPCYQENDILFAVSYITETAFQIGRPLVLCVALGNSQGGHSGQGVLPTYMNLIAATPGVAVVASAGNEGMGRRHYFGVVDRTTGYNTVELNVGENEAGFFMEIWGSPPSILSLDILSPSGEYVPRISPSISSNTEISFVFEQTIIYIDYQMVEALTGDQLILLRFENPVQGIWRFNVYEQADLNLGFHIWLPMNGFISDNTFFINSDPYTTVLSYGNAVNPMTVTAYNPVDDSLYLNSSRGFTRSVVVKPDVAAPGVDIIGPTLEQGYASFSGTSPATAHAAGIFAMLMEWGIGRGNLPLMSTIEARKLVIRGARRDQNMIYPNRDWGYGILDIYNVFDRLRTGAVF